VLASKTVSKSEALGIARPLPNSCLWPNARLEAEFPAPLARAAPAEKSPRATTSFACRREREEHRVSRVFGEAPHASREHPDVRQTTGHVPPGGTSRQRIALLESVVRQMCQPLSGLIPVVCSFTVSPVGRMR